MVVKEALGELEGAVDEGGEELVAEAEDLFFDGKGPGALGGGKEGGEALFVQHADWHGDLRAFYVKRPLAV